MEHLPKGEPNDPMLVGIMENERTGDHFLKSTDREHPSQDGLAEDVRKCLLMANWPNCIRSVLRIHHLYCCTCTVALSLKEANSVMIAESCNPLSSVVS